MPSPDGKSLSPAVGSPSSAVKIFPPIGSSSPEGKSFSPSVGSPSPQLKVFPPQLGRLPRQLKAIKISNKSFDLVSPWIIAKKNKLVICIDATTIDMAKIKILKSNIFFWEIRIECHKFICCRQYYRPTVFMISPTREFAFKIHSLNTVVW